VNRKERARRTIEALREVIPSPETELRHENPYELIVAVILSAQCTDERVNLVTPALIEAFPTIHDMARAEPEDILPYIRSVTFPNNKSKHLVNMARRVVDEYQGRIPESVSDLMTLQGVGRKTAQVVSAVAFENPAIAVDTHVFRVANRIGLVKNADTPFKVERQLKRAIPKADWSEAHHLLILHGRYTCTARNPKCEICPVNPFCIYYARMQGLPADVSKLNERKGKYYCKTRNHYFDDAALHTDRHGTEQICCPACGSMNVYYTKSGKSAKKVRDYRV